MMDREFMSNMNQVISEYYNKKLPELIDKVIDRRLEIEIRGMVKVELEKALTKVVEALK